MQVDNYLRFLEALAPLVLIADKALKPSANAVRF